MVETYQFGLPLVAANQAQKHVTVNEALSRLDAVAQLRVVSAAIGDPVSGAIDGQAYVVATGATGAWAGHETEIALWANGGWVFLQPKAGWQAWDEATSSRLIFDGAGWAAGGGATGLFGAATTLVIDEVEHVIGSGSTSTVAAAIPAQSVVFGVTGRVTAAITGSLSTWQLGTVANPSWYGSSLGVSVNSYALGLTGQPQTFYSDTDLVLTAEAGSFSGGTVRLAVHALRLTPPVTV